MQLSVLLIFAKPHPNRTAIVSPNIRHPHIALLKNKNVLQFPPYSCFVGKGSTIYQHPQYLKVMMLTTKCSIK